MNTDVQQAVSDLLASIPGTDAGSPAEPASRAAFELAGSQGWAQVGLPEGLGGAGGTLIDAASVAAACAASPHQLPLPDLVIVTARLLQTMSMTLPADVRCALPLADAATVDSAGALHVEVHRVPWGRWASHFLVLTGDREQTTVHLVDAADALLRPGYNLAQEPRDDVTLAGARPLASVHADRPLAEVVAAVELAGALTRSIQMAAAAAAALDLTATYCCDRRQFGRRLADFQAVQQELAALNGEVAAAAAAVDYALATAAVDDGAALPAAAIAVAKTRTGTAAGQVARSAHQLHGAIGITLEYPLHRHTRALWSWRDECGVESYWARILLAELTSATPGTPWEKLTAG